MHKIIIFRQKQTRVKLPKYKFMLEPSCYERAFLNVASPQLCRNPPDWSIESRIFISKICFLKALHFY